MINFIFMNKYMIIGIVAIIGIVLCTLSLMHIREWKEQFLNYSDPVITTMLETIYPLIVGLLLLWLLNGFEYSYLNTLYNEWLLRYINRNANLFNIESLKIFMFFTFVQFPLKSIHFILVFTNIFLIYRIFRIIIKKKSYFFRDRNHEFRLFDINGERWKKVYYDRKTFKSLKKVCNRYRKVFISYFKKKCSEVMKIDVETMKKCGQYGIYTSTSNFYSSLVDLEILIFRLNTNLNTNDMYELAHYTLPQLIKQNNQVDKNIEKFSKIYGKLIDEEESKIFMDCLRYSSSRILDEYNEIRNK